MAIRRECFIFFFQAEDGIRDLVRSRGLGDVYKRQMRVGSGIVQRVSLLRSLPLGVVLPALLLAITGLALSLIHI